MSLFYSIFVLATPNLRVFGFDFVFVGPRLVSVESVLVRNVGRITILIKIKSDHKSVSRPRVRRGLFHKCLNFIDTVQHQKVFVKVLLKVRNPKYFEPNYKSALLLFLRPTLRWISEQSLSAFHSSNARLYKKSFEFDNFLTLYFQQNLLPTAHFEN